MEFSKYIYVVFILLIFSCAKEDPEIVKSKDMPIAVANEAILLSPTVTDNYFITVLSDSTDAYYSSISTSGEITHLNALTQYAPQGISLDQLNQVDFWIHDEKLSATLIIDTTTTNFEPLHYKVFTGKIGGEVIWQRESSLIPDPDKKESYEFKGNTSKDDNLILAFLKSTSTQSTQFKGENNVLQFYSFDSQGNPLDTLETEEIPGRIITIAKSAQGNFFVVPIQIDETFNPSSELWYVEPNANIKKKIVLPFSGFGIYRAYETDSGVLIIGHASEDLEGLDASLMLVYINNDYEVTSVEIPERFHPHFPFMHENQLMILGAFSQEDWVPGGDFYQYNQADLAIWNTTKSGSDAILQFQSQSPTIGLALKKTSDGNWCVLSAKKSFSQFSEIQLTKITPDGVFVE